MAISVLLLEHGLLANMRDRSIADEYCNYIGTVLTQRQIHLEFNDQLSESLLPLKWVLPRMSPIHAHIRAMQHSSHSPS